MWKELTICIVIIVVVVVGNYITQKYTDKSVEEITDKLDNLKEEILNNDSQEKIKSSVNDVEKSWDNRRDKLAYYLEHDELEKVEAHITSLKSFIETEEYPEAICELDNGVFVLKHIEEKYAFSVENLF